MPSNFLPPGFRVSNSCRSLSPRPTTFHTDLGVRIFRSRYVLSVYMYFHWKTDNWNLNTAWHHYSVSHQPSWYMWLGLLVCTGLLVDTFYRWSGALSHQWIYKGPKQILEGSSIEIHYKVSNFAGTSGSSSKISHGPNWISGAQGPKLWAP